jgi:diguanylate cyclase (GGDEF)-like protein
MHFGEQIRTIVGGQPFEYEGDRFQVTISVGVYTLNGESIDPETFIRQADANLYRAKREGRNRVIG